MDPDFDLLAEALDTRPIGVEPLRTAGYARSWAWRVETEDGAVFAKQAQDEGSVPMLRREALVYRDVAGPFIPSFVGFADSGARALLAIELLEDAYWPPPYPATSVHCSRRSIS